MLRIAPQDEVGGIGAIAKLEVGSHTLLSSVLAVASFRDAKQNVALGAH
jgi:hypothetical protein